MAGSRSVRHGEKEDLQTNKKADIYYFQVVDTPGFGNSLEEEEVSSDAVVDLELPGISSPYLISAGQIADMSHQVGLQENPSQANLSPVF